VASATTEFTQIAYTASLELELGMESVAVVSNRGDSYLYMRDAIYNVLVSLRLKEAPAKWKGGETAYVYYSDDSRQQA